MILDELKTGDPVWVLVYGWNPCRFVFKDSYGDKTLVFNGTIPEIHDTKNCYSNCGECYMIAAAHQQQIAISSMELATKFGLEAIKQEREAIANDR